jgi:hypothetical protein
MQARATWLRDPIARNPDLLTWIGGRRARWPILSPAWMAVAWLAILDARAVRDYVSMLDESGTLPADSLPLRCPVLAPYGDTYTWVRYALAVHEGGPWRLRWTNIDNAPVGRAVYWNSAYVHLVGVAGSC